MCTPTLLVSWAEFHELFKQKMLLRQFCTGYQYTGKFNLAGNLILVSNIYVEFGW